VIVNSWDLKTLDLKSRLPEILSSSDAARAIALNLAAARASQTTRCTSARGLSCSTGRSRWRPRRGTHDRRRWAAGGVRARRAPRGDRDRRCAAAAAPDPMAGQRASWRDDHPRSTPAATPPSRHSDLNPLGSGPRGGPTLGQAGPLGLTAQARLTAHPRSPADRAEGRARPAGHLAAGPRRRRRAVARGQVACSRSPQNPASARVLSSGPIGTGSGPEFGSYADLHVSPQRVRYRAECGRAL
jgi:hypothetical protein